MSDPWPGTEPPAVWYLILLLSEAARALEPGAHTEPEIAAALVVRLKDAADSLAVLDRT